MKFIDFNHIFQLFSEISDLNVIRMVILKDVASIGQLSHVFYPY